MSRKKKLFTRCYGHCHCPYHYHCHCNSDCHRHRHVEKIKEIRTEIESIIAVLKIIFGDGNCILSILSINENHYLLLN